MLRTKAGIGITVLIFHHSRLELIDLSKEGLRRIGMCHQGDGREQIEREYTHDRLSVDGISSLNKIHLILYENYFIYKSSYVLNIGELDSHFFHNNYLLKYFCIYYIKGIMKCQQFIIYFRGHSFIPT